jgi:hypothetical protein
VTAAGTAPARRSAGTHYGGERQRADRTKELSTLMLISVSGSHTVRPGPEGRVSTMKQDDPSEARDLQVLEQSLRPGLRLQIGETLVCPTCAVSGVVRALPAPRGAGPICHGPMTVGRPVPCAEIRLRRSDDVMIGGRLYEDEVSGFAFWCTRGGPGQVLFDDRPLRLQSMAAAV